MPLAPTKAEADLLPPANPPRGAELPAIAGSAGTAGIVVPQTFGPLGFCNNLYVVSESDVAVILDVDYPPSLTAPVALSVIVEPGGPGGTGLHVANQIIVAGPGEPAARILQPLIADSIGEYTEEFLVRLTSDDPAVQIGSSEAVIVILDDD